MLIPQSTQQFYAPSSYYQDDTAAAQQQLNGDGTEAGATVAQCSVDSTSEPTQSQPALDYNLSLPAEIQQNSQPVQNYNVSSQPSQDYSTAQSTGQTSAAPTASIADVLAAVSDRALDRCGYQYDEYLDMFYDASSNLYYHQVSSYFGEFCSLLCVALVSGCFLFVYSLRVLLECLFLSTLFSSLGRLQAK